jgi:hypothetical protein
MQRTRNQSGQPVERAPEHYDLIKELLPRLTNVRTFSVLGGFDAREDIWPMLLDAFRHMTVITRLTVECWDRSLLLNSIFLVDLPKLKSLSLDGICIPDDDYFKELNMVSRNRSHFHIN